ncbi:MULTISPECIES: 3-dehydroquinate synthase [Heyndrickxia]|uniref:3-dehydroquinate synthase n=1 Tax=Heyndrickxia TaxID=2837504 RepID=UPI0003FC7597|nr:MULTISPECIES: 3-dehydroquinate synthase [Heyndrickxia]AWP37166.1 3-dehydroquinate synthase [Heyndrickxia coagulans]MEC2305129.1 3-dehydroquinate synthase [Weizmannia sp. CD-2023]MEC2340184.1 3-dehydroquinate synthase [Weizmannia sp. CD-2023]MED4893105.1 3-dehydroquinate synthase [Weizmannia sp. CD-2023]NMH85212.1 3-dehydroquinate synthase [Heyndrickxia coagulans]
METIIIDTETKQYPVYIASGALQELGPLVRKYTRCMVITDQNVRPLHLDKLLSQLPESAEQCVLTVPAGEDAKTFEVYQEALTFAVEHHLDRKSCILAFGGGAVGDLAGFVAATYMRGIAFIQIPTTILAHDSAVGGKVAINHPLGKNLVGAFYQPEFVLYDTDFLRTLPKKQLLSGFAELVKHALLSDKEFLKELQTKIPDGGHLLSPHLPDLLKKGIKVKADIVRKDEKETGVRAFLNFGHTLGHALEAHGGFGKITHGEAVMTGIVYALLISREQTGLQFDLPQFLSWIETLGYGWKIPAGAAFDEIYAYMKRDKKTIAGNIHFVLLESVGKPVLAEVDKDRLSRLFLLQQKGDLHT